ncbi:unnamed protein product, partial [Mesorhabditis belari]|uniref:Uncharacterized protein n=1 Tax=Mesorhabditis belari TaxID=2138241 RepID=A0AAF3J6U3_9BILA
MVDEKFRVRRFRDGDESLEDEKRGNPPQIVDNDELKNAIESDPCQTTRELAEPFDCDHITILRPLHAIATQTRRLELQWLEFSSAPQRPPVFSTPMKTSDEKWICYDNTTRKRQWLDAGEPLKPTPKPNIHENKRDALYLVE